MNDLTKEILNEMEQDKIIAFCNDPIMFEAVKKYLLFHIVSQGTFEPGKPVQADRNWAMQMGFQAIHPSGMPRTDAEIGADIRAFAKGMNALESGFKELAGLKKNASEVEEVAPNKAV